MGRPSTATRTRNAIGQVLALVGEGPRRHAALFGGIALTVAAHGLLADPQLAWASAPIVLFAGILGGTRLALIAAGLAAAAHAAVDVVTGIALPGIAGIAVRSVVLIGVGLIGAVGAQIERQRDRAMERAVNEDPVTGLLNVRTFYDELGRLRDAQVPFAILLADIRGMRALNDRYGHPTGTEAMRALAHVLRRSAGTDVLASRLGSDELAVALVGDDRNRCRSVVERMVERLHDEQVSLPDGERFEVHAAYGIARFPEDGDDEIAVLRAADRAKEIAKSAGIDRVGTAAGDVL